MANNVGLPVAIPELTLENWMPMEPAKGPPLPSFLGLYWPWYTPALPPVAPPEEKPPPIPSPGEPPPEEAPAEIVFSMLIVSPAKVYVGDKVRISVKATNTGDTAAEYDLYLGDDTGLSAHIALAPGESNTYTWEFVPSKTGHYSMWANGLHAMFEVTTKEEEVEMPPIYGTILYTVSSWTVYSAADGRGRVYRYGLRWSVVELWIESDGVHRIQVKGTTPFGVWPQHHIFEPGNIYYDTYVAMFAYMDDGCPKGYRSSGSWMDQVAYCSYHRPGTPEWDEMNELNKFYCDYSPYTYPK